MQKHSDKNPQSGNIIFLLLLGIILLAGVTYAVSQSSRSSTSLIEAQISEAEITKASAYSSTMSQAIKRLQLRGCSDSEISYETTGGDNANPNAPADESCHVFRMNGGQISQAAPDLVYLGELSGNSIYTTASSSGTTTYGPEPLVTGATSTTDGLANTNILVGLGGHPSADLCRALGPDWYLPAREELTFILNNIDAAGIGHTLGNSRINTSTEFDTDSKHTWLISQFYVNNSNGSKTVPGEVRCLIRL